MAGLVPMTTQPELFRRIGNRIALHIYFPQTSRHNIMKQPRAAHRLAKPNPATAPRRKRGVTRQGWVFLSQPPEKD